MPNKSWLPVKKESKTRGCLHNLCILNGEPDYVNLATP